ncbi:MAG: hypothetical protein HRU81_07090 [Gammaproteobacteria bacterium]|nr:MAG: hypothetical protein HRU81_07090 [Gammaproteobacteria bacterium]
MTPWTTRVLPLLLALAAAGSAQASLKAIEQAYELDPAEVSLPAATGGSLALRRCAGCAAELLRVDAHTQFQVLPGAGNVSLDVLRREAGRVASRPRTSIFVYFDPRSGIVRRIVLDATQ